MSATQSRNRVKHILSIGTLCGLILATLFVLSIRDTNRLAAQSLSDTLAVSTQLDNTTNKQSDLQSQLAALQAQNQQLSAELQATQAQAVQYQRQLAQAVQIIRQLQGQSPRASASR